MWVGFKEEEYLFYVADNGMGIEDRYREEIFKPLKSAHPGKENTALVYRCARR